MVRNKILMILSAAVLILLTVSCNGANQAPTIDADLIYTQAAQTVEAQLTEVAAQLPTATNTLPPTATELPPTPTVLNIGQTTGTPVPLFTMPSSSTFTAPLGTQAIGVPTATVRVQVQGDKAQWYFSHPSDGATLSRSESFTFIVGMGNVGSTTWNTNYRLNFVGGTVISAQSSVPLEWETPPGETAEFYVLAKAPDDPGSYTTYWQVVNDAGVRVQESMYWQFNIQ